ncbi:uncharacterized protein LOC123922269 [Trifolium pratense]|nr:uncharacterized protein LOC123922269 [Trifolium pratense]
MDNMITNALGFNTPIYVPNDVDDPADDEYDADVNVERPNEEAQRFFDLLKETNTPLCEGSRDSKLTVCIRLLGIKSECLVSEYTMDLITKLMLDITIDRPLDLPKNYYEARQLVAKLGLGAKRIDCCVNGCMLYYSNEFGVDDGALLECKFCQEPRYRVTRNSRSVRRKPIPRKAMFYLPIIPRLQRLYASMQTASKMTWHRENYERRKMSDGFTPYTQVSATPYSCWPVLVTPYNLPPDMCMSKPYMFLAAVIPGPSSPTVGIDIYLQPLIDDLKRLWNGVATYDINQKRNFNMRGALMWTINDFPAYGMLSGWGTHGKLGCPICMMDTKAFWLHNGGKATWFDCHRRFLPTDHPFRRNKNAFVHGDTETRDPPDYLTSRQVWNKVKDIPKVEVVGGVASKPRGYGQTHNWTKRRKTKDNDNARRDIGLYCKRNELLLVETSNGKLLKPRANYTLSPEEAKSVCRWVKEVKMPDGYSSNLARCADVDHGRMRGMKSHDCHVFFQTLLPIAFSSLPQHVLNPLIEISQFFKNLCSTTLREADLIKMENDIPLILCKLERIFPPALFDSMEHVVVHLAYEARLGGPVQYRWMYPFERFMGYAKRAVKNKARVEGSICATYLHRETIYFCSHYFKDTLSSSHIRNETETSRPVRIHPLNMSIFSLPGRNGGGEKVLYPGDKVLYSAHVHLLINCNEVEPYLQ